MAGSRGRLVGLFAVRAAGGGQCMMLAAARMFGMEPGGVVTAPTYDSGTPTVLTLWLGRGGVWCACPLPVSEKAPGFGVVGALVGVVMLAALLKRIDL